MKMIGCKVSGCPIFVLCNRTGETHFTQNMFVRFFVSLVRAKELVPPLLNSSANGIRIMYLVNYMLRKCKRIIILTAKCR